MATRERTAADQHLEMPYELSLVRRSGEGESGWKAHVEELPGCEAFGETEEEAIAEVRAAMASWITNALENNRPIPPPKAAATHSGRLLVRMPPTLHAHLARMADKEKVSLNTLIVGILGGATQYRGMGGGETGWASLNGSTASASDTSTQDLETARGRLVSWALAANLVVVVVAGLLAIGLLIAILVT
jgi:predicted RNase H-like HicB family nuclease